MTSRGLNTNWLRRLAIVGLFVLLACSYPPSRGYVIDKNYTPAHYHEYDTTYLICAGSGKYGCTAWVPIPVHHEDYIPDEWGLLLENCYDQKECQRGWIEVSQSVYDKFPIGSHYPSPR